jgi:hypothetical protein
LIFFNASVERANLSPREAANEMTYERRCVLLEAFFIVGLLLASGWAQTEPQENSLGDVAKKTRDQKTAKDHVSARKVLTDENAASANWVKRTHSFWATNPPATLTLSVPATNRKADEQSIEIPLEHSSFYVAFGGTIWSDDCFCAAEKYLSSFVSQSRYGGATLKIGAVESTAVGSQPAMLMHLAFNFNGIPHKGVVLFVKVPEQILTVSCMYREVDWEKADPICSQVINSAEAAVPEKYKSIEEPDEQ